MKGFRTAKMTVKAKSALETYALLFGVPLESVRKDRAAVRGIYAELEDRNYQWIPMKGEWAYMPDTEAAAKVLNLMISCDEDRGGEALYVLEESMKAGGFELGKIEREIIPALPYNIVIFYVEVKL